MLVFKMSELRQKCDLFLLTILFMMISQGCASPGASYEIFGGEVADLSKWPYLISFQLSRGGSSDCYFHQCGGALIAADVAITAAHCVTQGRWLGSGSFEGAPQQQVFATQAPPCRHLSGGSGRFGVRHIVMSPEWSQSDLVGDVALVFLDSSLQGPFLNYQNNINIYDGQELQIAGYGIMMPSERSDFQKNVRPAYRAILNSISRDNCIELMSQFNFNSGDKIDYERVFCARSEYSDTCSGDSGGPLVLKGSSPGEDSLVGLASWGPRIQCENENEPQAPSAFARISYFSSWISDTISRIQNNNNNNNNNNNGGDYQGSSGVVDNYNNNNQYDTNGDHSSKSDSYLSLNGGSLLSMNQESAPTQGPPILSQEAGTVDCGDRVRECVFNLKETCCQSVDVNNINVNSVCVHQRRDYYYKGVCSQNSNAHYLVADRGSSVSQRGCICYM